MIACVLTCEASADKYPCRGRWLVDDVALEFEGAALPLVAARMAAAVGLGGWHGVRVADRRVARVRGRADGRIAVPRHQDLLAPRRHDISDVDVVVDIVYEHVVSSVVLVVAGALSARPNVILEQLVATALVCVESANISVRGIVQRKSSLLRGEQQISPRFSRKPFLRVSVESRFSTFQ